MMVVAAAGGKQHQNQNQQRKLETPGEPSDEAQGGNNKRKGLFTKRKEKKQLEKAEAARYLELRRQGVDEVSNTKEAAAMREYKLRKKKRKGVFRKKQRSMASILFPGVSPEDYVPNTSIHPDTDLVVSKKTNIPFAYYDLPFCQEPRGLDRIKTNLGSRLQGLRPHYSPYHFRINSSRGCAPICVVNIKAKKINFLRKLIQRQYRVQLSLDGLPVVMKSKQLNYMVKGYPIGFKSPPHVSGVEKDEFFLYNHLEFEITYQEDSAEFDGVRITGFDVRPVSVTHDVPDTPDNTKIGHRFFQEDEIIETCNGNEQLPQVINDPETYLALKMGPNKEALTVVYSYGVNWIESDLTWADRWDIYIVGAQDDDVHFFAIVNSLMIVLFLTAAIATIMIRTLKKDIAGYNNAAANEQVEQTGWKLVHGDVFRPPETHPMLFSVFVGTGAQIGVACFLSLVLCMAHIINPLKKGQTLTGFVLLYVLSGSVAGYISARMYKFSDQKEWKMNTILTAALLPGCLVAIFVTLNLFLAFQGAATSVSFLTIMSLLALWICIATPLVFVGSFFGLKSDKIEVPSKTNQIARIIPDTPWYITPPLSFFLGGVLPFGSVCIELFFIMSAIWLHQIYYVMGFLLALLFILFATCAEVSIVMCYLQLCAEDHRWYWKSFWNTATAGCYLALYSLWFLVSRLELVGILPVVVYLSYMTMISVCFGLFCGTVGVLTNFLFIRQIYGQVKLD